MCPQDWGGGRTLQRAAVHPGGRPQQDPGGDRDLGVAQITFENVNFSLQEEGLRVTVWGGGGQEAWQGPWTEDELRTGCGGLGAEQGRGALLAPLLLLASQVESGTRILVGSCAEPTFQCPVQTHCSSGRASVSPRTRTGIGPRCPGAWVSRRTGEGVGAWCPGAWVSHGRGRVWMPGAQDTC